MTVPGADSEEKREPVSDIDTAVVDSLKALDPKRPIREGKSRLQSRRGEIKERAQLQATSPGCA